MIVSSLCLGPYLYVSSVLLPALATLGIPRSDLKWLSDEETEGKVCRLVDNDICVQYLGKSANEVFSEFVDLLTERDLPFCEETYQVVEFSETGRKVFFALFGNRYTMQYDTFLKKVSNF